MNHRLQGLRANRDGRDPAALLEARFAKRVVANLNETVQTLPHDVTERLRVARAHALEHARAAARQAPVFAPATPLRAPARNRASAVAGGAAAPARREPSAWWRRLATALPLAALVGGLVLIQQHHLDQQIAAAAEIDADLLTDALPPAAYGDAGFLEFLKEPRN